MAEPRFITAAEVEGQVIPSGGNTDQVLAKNSNADFDLKWAAGGGGSSEASLLLNSSGDSNDTTNHPFTPDNCGLKINDVQNVLVGQMWFNWGDHSTYFGIGNGNNVSGSNGFNTIIGYGAVIGMTTGEGNTVIGADVDNGGFYFLTGSHNVFIGDSSGVSSTDINDSVVVGSGAKSDGGSAVVIGQGAYSGLDSEVVIGQGAQGGGLNSMAIGIIAQTSAQDSIAIGARVNVSSPGVAAVGDSAITDVYFGYTSPTTASAIAHAGAFATTPLTVATLPASPTLGMISSVSDGTAGLAWGATLTGGGGGDTTKYLVWYNGANWTVMGK